MGMRYLGGINSPSYNPLAANVTTGVTTVQGGGVFTGASASQNIPLGQWADDQYFNKTSVLLQADGTANAAQNNTFLDSSSNTFTITRVGNTTQGSVSPFSNPVGSWSNYFDGSTGYLTLTGSSNLAFGTNDFTIECFIYLNVLPTAGQAMIYDSRPGADGAYPTFFVDITTRVLTWYVNTGYRIVGTTALTINQWYHVAACRVSGVTRLFLNGVQEGTSYTDSTTYLNGASRPILANNGLNLTGYLSGFISNLRVVNGGTGLYSSNFIPPTTPLTAIPNTQLLVCHNPYNKDYSSNNFTLTKTGTVNVRPIAPITQPSYSPSVNSGSIFFDGTGDYITVGGNSNLAFGTNDFTIECFVYFTSTASFQTIYDSRPNATSSGAYPSLYYSSSPALIYYYANGANRIASDAAPPSNQWIHIVVSRVSGTTRMFINGVQQAGTYTDSTTYLNGASRPILGASGDIQNNPFFGYISNVRALNGTGFTSVTIPTVPFTPTSSANTQLLLSAANAGIYDATCINNFETVGNAQVNTTFKKYGSGSMYFDGTGDWILAPDNIEQRLGTGDFTIECWVYVSSFASPRAMCGKGTNTTGWYWYVATTGKLAFGYGTSTFNGTNAIVLNTWNHVAVVRFGAQTTNLKMYINGNLDTTSTSAVTYDMTTANNLYVGCDRIATNPFLGYIDDLRITKGFARYTSNFLPPTVALPRMG